MKLIDPELKQFLEEVSDTCFVKIKKNEDIAVLYYKSGKLTELRINNSFEKDRFDEILTWKNPRFEKVKIDPVTKFKSEDLKYIFDSIEFYALSADIYIKQKRNILVLSFSEGALISVIPETEVTKDFIRELLNIKVKNIKMKLTGEKIGNMKIFLSELLD